MAVLTSAPISELAIELLRRQLVLVNTVARVPAGEYAGPSGGTVTVAVPTPRNAREQDSRGRQIVFDEQNETPVNVVLSHWYSGTLVSDEQMTLDITNFGRQIVAPQTESVARAAEDQLAQTMNGLTASEDILWSGRPDPTSDRQTVLAVREALTVNDVPAGARFMAVAPDIATRLLNIPGFVEADKRGATTALDQAIIGQVFGLTFVESNALDPGTSVGYHSTGFAFGSARPADPGGGADSTTVSDGGVSLRVVKAFDVGHLSEAVVTSVFAGCAVVPEDDRGTIKRAIRIETSGS